METNNTVRPVKPVLLITGCRKYFDYLLAAIKRFSVEQTWEVIGIVGGDQTQFDETTRVLTLSVPDTYEALPRKMFAAFEWIHKHRPGAGVFKTDDDIVFDVPALAQKVHANKFLCYWGVAVGQCNEARVSTQRIQNRFTEPNNPALKLCPPTHQKATYCFGWGYWLSPDTIPLLTDEKAKAEYEKSFLEDVCTGFLLNSHDILPARIRPPFQECARTPELLTLS